jgi:threonine aldolase
VGRLARVIDLRSDTATRPTEGMRAAIAAAAVGDEQRREDPSVNELQERVAPLVGHEAAVFLPTATMANQIALKLHSRPGDVLVAEATSHVVIYEYGGPAAHAGLVTLGLPGRAGRVTPEQVRAATAPSTKLADQRAVVLSLEDTHNSAGGRVWPLAELDEVVATARELGLAVHLDGARLLNAAVAQAAPPARIASQFDTVTLCLSKGLGCPLGALLAGSAELIDRAWRQKHLFGGAMRQAGIVAAGGLYALEHHVDRLAEDHVNAARLAAGLAGIRGLEVEPPQTNMVFVRIPSDRTAALKAHLEQSGVLALIGPRMRLATHLDVSADGIDRALAAFRVFFA